jgi:thiol-disulfide isomerase/thioredoxin
MLKKILKNKKFRKVAIVVGVLVLGVIGYQLILKRKEGMDNEKDTFALLHMTGCGHCVKLMPEWDKAKSEWSSGKNSINMVKYEQSEAEGKKLIDKFGVSGFPTMILIGKDGEKKDDYSGDRSSEGIINYLKQQ